MSIEPDWEQFKSEIKKQLSTFPENAKPTLLYVWEGHSDYSLDVIATLKIIRSSNNKRESAVAGMLAFLWGYEGDYMTCVDAFCLLLIANGHDLFDLVRRKYAKSLEEIGNVDISTKLKFLEEHNFGIFKREKDKELRNKIAHHDFQLDDSGNVQISNAVVDVGLRFNELFSFTKKVFETLCGCLDVC